jgi:2-haloacid dehalogenase
MKETVMRDIVVFDFGGVLFDWNPRHLYRTLIADEAEMERFLSEVANDAWNARQDAGRPWDEAIAELVERYPAQEALIRAYRERWPETLAGSFPDTVAVLHELKAAGTPLYGLTNWSQETFPLAQARFPVLDLFDGIVVSGQEGMAKPDPRIFRRLLERFSLAAERLVFIDDNRANVDAAVALGIHAIHFTDAVTLRQELVGLGLLEAIV